MKAGGVRDGVCDDEAGSPRFGFGISSSSRTIVGKTTALLSLPTFFLLVLLLQI
jgi:hypothetical protein